MDRARLRTQLIAWTHDIMLTDRTHIIGTIVVSPAGERLGDIKKLVRDPNNGRVTYAVVAFGGFFSMANDLFAIPFAALEYNARLDAYVLDIAKAQLIAAPGVHAKWLRAGQGEGQRLTA